MSLELDKRIKDINDIQSVLNSSKGIIGKRGYLAKSIRDFKNLNKCEYNIIDDYREDDECFCHSMKFTTGIIDTTWYSYFIPEDKLKPAEKRYRQYTPNEWKNKYSIGRWMHFRYKNFEYTLLYLGFKETEGLFEVNISGKWYNLYELYTHFEEDVLGEWKPFGIEE